MKTVFHKADSRGHANHGWLDSYHTFSFANYQDDKRSNFGVLRVVNDDTVKGGMGFGTHPHRDMEIISIPLEGDLEHKDSTGTRGVIQKGEIQVMSAGKGVQHSEYNHNKDKDVKFLQIWIFPRELGVEPRGEQMSMKDGEIRNEFQQIISPNVDDAGLWIHQDAWFNLAKFDKGISRKYKIHQEGNGVYVFVVNGSAKIDDQELNSRDGFGIWDVDGFKLEATEDAEILLMEIPMNLPEYLR
ncbi:pirin family protein [Moheibacter sediminis]|uniref:Pirin N-terminal domain-containing protein n=1 Tax=Moheibacter sediminis TaxID=1434700 RepID=A0A1W2BH63_9FLAO|nr:pirin family protein [Moheibacter sediminis]SMC72237.1 hypothetical protein SAMN06296427_106171 [Moheibacter sediminis]